MPTICTALDRVLADSAWLKKQIKITLGNVQEVTLLTVVVVMAFGIQMQTFLQSTDPGIKQLKNRLLARFQI